MFAGDFFAPKVDKQFAWLLVQRAVADATPFYSCSERYANSFLPILWWTTG